MSGRGDGIDIDHIVGYGVKQECHDGRQKKDLAITLICNDSSHRVLIEMLYPYILCSIMINMQIQAVYQASKYYFCRDREIIVTA